MEARYEERIRACSSEAELAEYLLSCIPVIKEYTSEVESGSGVSTKKVAGVYISTRKGVQRNDIYKKYLKEVEGGNGWNPRQMVTRKWDSVLRVRDGENEQSLQYSMQGGKLNARNFERFPTRPEGRWGCINRQGH